MTEYLKPAYSVLLVLLMFAISQVSFAEQVISEADKQLTDFSIGYLYDDSNSMAIKEISQTTFPSKIPSQFALGYRAGSAWFKITLHNSSQNPDFVLYFTEAFWSTLDLYAYEDDAWSVQNNGLDVPIDERQIKHAMPSFPVTIAPGSTAVFYVRGTTVSSHIGEFKVFTQDEFSKAGRTSTTEAYMLYSGVLLFIMLFVGLLFLKMREALYLYYVGYVTSYIVWLFSQGGNYLYLGIPGWDNALHAIGTLVVAFLVLFSKSLLRLDEKAPWTGISFSFFAGWFFLCGIAITLNIPLANVIFNLTSSAFFALLLVTSIQAWNGHYFSDARLYLVALIIYMITMGLMTLTYNGLLSNQDLTRYAFLFGSAVEILFFSYVLASRYRKAYVGR